MGKNLLSEGLRDGYAISRGRLCGDCSPAISVYDLEEVPTEVLNPSLTHSILWMYSFTATLCRICVIMYRPEYNGSSCGNISRSCTYWMSN